MFHRRQEYTLQPPIRLRPTLTIVHANLLKTLGGDLNSHHSHHCLSLHCHRWYMGEECGCLCKTFELRAVRNHWHAYTMNLPGFTFSQKLSHIHQTLVRDQHVVNHPYFKQVRRALNTQTSALFRTQSASVYSVFNTKQLIWLTFLP